MWDEQIYYVISHDPWIYFGLMIKYLLFLVALRVWYYYIQMIVEFEYLNIVLWVIGLILYSRFIIWFLDYYLDSIVLTDGWLIIFRWDGFLKQTSESVTWDSIESVFDEQSGIIDLLLKKWDIKVKRQWEVYTFKDVSHPTSKLIKSGKWEIRYYLESKKNLI